MDTVTRLSALLAPGLLLLLLTLRIQELVESCSCGPAHPQQKFCDADIVIRAKVSSEKVISPNGDPDHPMKTIQYEIKQIKMFRGSEKIRDVQYVYTSYESSLCGVTLEANNKKHYLLTGYISTDGKVQVNLCNYIEPWDNLTVSQRRNFNHQRYQMGCDCKIITCYSLPCNLCASNECLWTDWLIERNINGQQAKNFACIKLSDNSCSWYHGGPLPGREFVNISET